MPDPPVNQPPQAPDSSQGDHPDIPATEMQFNSPQFSAPPEEPEPNVEGRISEPVSIQGSITPPRRSARAGAQKPPGFYSKLNSGESDAD